MQRTSKQKFLHLKTKQSFKHQNIFFKLMKTNNKEKILKDISGKRHIIYKGTNIKIASYFSAEQWKPRGKCGDSFKILEQSKNELSTYIFTPNKNIFQNSPWNRSDTFSESTFSQQFKKLKVFNVSRLTLKEILKEAFHSEEICCQT